LERHTQRKIDFRFATLKLRSLYRAGSLKTVTSEMTKYNLGLLAIQEVRWVNGGGQPADDYIYFM